MNTLVTFDSTFGNTEQVARAIAEVIGERGSVRLVPVDQVNIPGLGGVDLWVLGCPTQRHGLTAAMRALVKSIPRQALRGLRVAVFDTRYRMPAWKSGSAARVLTRRLHRRGASLIVPAESFYVVTREGPLENGALVRAAEWATSILERFKTRVVELAQRDHRPARFYRRPDRGCDRGVLDDPGH